MIVSSIIGGIPFLETKQGHSGGGKILSRVFQTVYFPLSSGNTASGTSLHNGRMTFK